MFKFWFWTLRYGGAVWRRFANHVATLLHRASLAKVGSGSRFQSGIRFDRPDQVEIGFDCYFWRGVGACAEGHDPSLRIGNHVQINRGVLLDMTGGLTIADDVLVSEHAVIYTHDHGLNPHSVPTPQSKIIGQGVWIGMRAVILPACRNIGVDAVIGAGAIVTHNVPAGAIVAGSPARVIGYRTAIEVAA